MFPMTDLDLDEEAAHYMPDDRLESWEEYDEKVLVSFTRQTTQPSTKFVQFQNKTGESAENQLTKDKKPKLNLILGIW